MTITKQDMEAAKYIEGFLWKRCGFITSENIGEPIAQIIAQSQQPLREAAGVIDNAFLDEQQLDDWPVVLHLKFKEID